MPLSDKALRIPDSVTRRAQQNYAYAAQQTVIQKALHIMCWRLCSFVWLGQAMLSAAPMAWQKVSMSGRNG